MRNPIVSAVQMVSGGDLERNLQTAETLIAQAAGQAAKFVVLPENFACFASEAAGGCSAREHAEQEEQHSKLRGFLKSQAKRHNIWLVGGTLPRVLPILNAPLPNHHSLGSSPAVSPRVFASVHTYSPEGEEVCRYDKIHLFDAGVQDTVGRYAESDTFMPGTAPGIFPAQLNNVASRMGLAVCYDLRFPALSAYFQAQQIDVLAVPSAFTAKTGAAHWHALLRARAIENQCLIVAANQGGDHGHGRVTYGHSCIIDAWGHVIAELPSGEGVVCAEWDKTAQDAIRHNMPIHQHRRPFPVG